MKKFIAKFIYIIIALAFFTNGCKKPEYTLGDIKAPTDLVLNTTIVNATAANPNGDGTGNVTINASANDALSYKIDYGDGTVEMVHDGNATHKYGSPGLHEYTITVNAIGTGGTISTLSKKITVLVIFELPKFISDALTNGSSKVWVNAADEPGHFGVGPADAFAPIWYAAPPNTRQPCAYDDEITFSKDAIGRVFMNVDNKGSSFLTGAATGFYGFSGGDDCYPLNTGGNKELTFSNATSGSTSDVSTGIQFRVPGNGIVNFGVGSNVYEILSVDNDLLHIRTIGADGNSWYQILKAK